MLRINNFLGIGAHDQKHLCGLGWMEMDINYQFT
jgi:hypothetical protein